MKQRSVEFAALLFINTSYERRETQINNSP